MKKRYPKRLRLKLKKYLRLLPNLIKKARNMDIRSERLYKANNILFKGCYNTNIIKIFI